MLIFETVKQYSEFFNNKIQHPLINFIDLSKADPFPRCRIRIDFYAIFIKDTLCGEFRYGNGYYDYAEGTMVFVGPHQIVGSEPEGEMHQPYGKALIFHPDLIKGTTLGKQIHEYTFFSYKINEALHLSDREREIVENCYANILNEISQNIDRHSKKLLVANLELMLKYCLRFYDRQFTTRESVNSGVIEKFDQKLSDYLLSENLKTIGLPSVNYFAKELHLSPNYFGDLIKKETGKTAKEYIHSKLMEVAKEKILDTSKNISEIAYELGFGYPQHFTRLFKQKVGLSPNEYRSLN